MENPPHPKIVVEANVVEVVNVLPCAVEYIIPLIYMDEPSIVDTYDVLPIRVENNREPPFMIGTDNVETPKVLP